MAQPAVPPGSLPKVIHEDEDLVVLARPGGSAFTLVTFGHLELRPGGGQFWGREPAERLDLDCIGLVAKAPHWYPAAAVARAAAAIRAAAKPVRIGYGYSMGGYGALKHGRLLGLTHALAVAPQRSIDPAEVPEDARFHAHFRPARHAGMAVRAEDLAPFAAVVADPWDREDGPHLAALAALGAHVVAAPFLGHWAIHLLSHTARLEALLARLRAEDPGGLRRVLREGRAQAAIWHDRLGAALLGHGHPEAADRVLAAGQRAGLQPLAVRRALAHGWFDRSRRLRGAGRRKEALAALRIGLRSLPKRDLPSVMTAGHTLVAQDELASAERMFRLALDIDPLHAEAAQTLGHLLVATKRLEEALELAGRIAAGRPDDAEALGWLGTIRVLNARLPEAEAPLRAALAMQPWRAEWHQRLVHLLRALGRPEDALEALRAAHAACRDTSALEPLPPEPAAPPPPRLLTRLFGRP